MRTNSLFVTVLLLSSLIGGCDSTVGLDPTTATFTKVLVPGVCPIANAPGQMRLSILLLNGKSSLQPESRIARETRTVGELLPKESFSFSKSSADVDIQGPEPGVLVKILDDLSEDAQKVPTVLQPIDRQYVFSGGQTRVDQGDSRLVVIVMDHSSTLAGFDPFTQELDPLIRTDQRDERITFFTQLVSNLPPEYKVSVVRMNSTDTKIEDCLAPGRQFDPCETPQKLCSVAFQKKREVECALKSLEAGETGRTPLNDTLKEVYDTLLTKSYAADNPVVIVFTDGLEEKEENGELVGGDDSKGYVINGNGRTDDTVPGFNDILAQGQARDLYAGGVNNSGIPVPVIVMHLQPPATSTYLRGRDSRLQQLACDTGGEYVFLESASLFTKGSNLQNMIANRIAGAWQVDISTSLAGATFEAGGNGYLLSSSLQVSLGGVERTADLTRSRDTQSVQDNRLWFVKED